MRPQKREQLIRSLEARAVCRDGMSPESYQELEDAETVAELRGILLDVFDPSKDEDE